jgi:hypothetical protein
MTFAKLELLAGADIIEMAASVHQMRSENDASRQLTRQYDVTHLKPRS